MKRIIPALLVLVGLAAFALPATAGDLVKLKNGRWLVAEPETDPPLREDFENSLITVVSEDYDKLEYTVKVGNRTTKQEYDITQVKEVLYYPKPQSWLDAAAAMESGDLPTAAEKFQAIAESSSNRAWLRMYSWANVAMIWESAGEWQTSINAWEALLKDFPRSRFAPQALVQAGLSSLQMGDVNGARNYFTRLQRLSGLPEGQKGPARYYLIYIKQRQGEDSNNSGLLQQALREYQELLEAVKDDPEQARVATLARLGIGACMVGLGQFDEATSYFQKIADSSDDPKVLAGAFNGLGQCYFKKERWKDALMAFLRVEVLYDDDPEQAAMALFYSGLCFQFMQGASIGKDNGTRARAQYRKCISKYGGSSWAAKAKERLPTVRND